MDSTHLSQEVALEGSLCKHRRICLTVATSCGCEESTFAMLLAAVTAASPAVAKRNHRWVWILDINCRSLMTATVC